MDSYAIAGAIVTLGQAISAPSGQPSIAKVTADLPESIEIPPTLLVLPPVMDDANYNASRNRSFTLRYPCGLYLSRADGSPRRAKAVHDWFTKLYPMVGGQLQLGLSYVALAKLMNLQGGSLTYGPETYDGLGWDIVVQVSESYSPAA